MNLAALFVAAELAALVEAPNGIASWDESLPLGNGQTGALVWGTNDTLLVMLDRADFWHNTLAGCYADPGFTWTNFVALCRSGNHDERRRVFGNRDNEPSKLPGVRLEMKLAEGQSLRRFQLAEGQSLRRFRLDARDGSAHITVATLSGERKIVAWFEDDSPYLSMNVPDGVSFASAAALSRTSVSSA